jgi:hypothetical protein
MKFATQELPANGQAALALVVALMEWLEREGKLIPGDKLALVARAQEIAPRGAGRTDKEAQAILAHLLDQS